MNQYSYDLYRAVAFIDIYESDLFLISADFGDSPEVEEKQPDQQAHQLQMLTHQEARLSL
jgi:hypothetical protein